MGKDILIAWYVCDQCKELKHGSNFDCDENNQRNGVCDDCKNKLNISKIMNEKIKQLVKEIKKLCPDDCTSVNIFFNYHDLDITFNTKSDDALRENGLSMENINGKLLNKHEEY